MKFWHSGIILVFLSTGIMTSCSQPDKNNTSPEEKRQFKVLFDSINKFDSLVNIYKVSDHHKSLYYARKALLSGITMHSNLAVARAYILLGISYYNHMNDSSFYFYNQASIMADRYNLKEIKPVIFYDLSMLYSSVQNNKMAVILLDSVIQISEQVKDYQILSNAYNSAGNIKLNLGDTSGSKRMFEKSYQIAKEHSLSKQTGVVSGELARLERNPDKSMKSGKDAIKYLIKSKGAEEEIASILINIGLVCPNTDTSIFYFEKAIEIAKSGKIINLEIAAYNNLAYSYLDKKAYSMAKASLNGNAIPLATKTGNIDWLPTLYDSYADVLFLLKQSDSAFYYEKLAMANRRDADKRQATGQIRLLAALLDDKNKEVRIQKNEQVIRHKQNIQFLLVFIIICTTLTIIFILILFSMRMQKSKFKLQMQEINSAKKLMEIEDKEKERIAMELHDLTTPLFLSISRQIEELSTKNNKFKSELRSEITVLANSIRNISHRLKRMVLDQFGFNDNLIRLCDDMQRLTEVPIKLKLLKDELNLPDEKVKHILRIIQELLTNAVKYVKNGPIELSVYIAYNNLYVTYRDSGPGFDIESHIKKGIGLMNIFDRARLLKGNAQLKSSPGVGTNCTITIPLDRKKRNNKNGK